ncbi:MAG: 50S ribosomal protein L20 [Planctomycetota bacterium]
MSRTRPSVASRNRRKKILKSAKGFRGGRSKLYRTAAETVLRSRVYAYRDRRQKKRDFRSLWITRINAATRAANMTYSRFIEGLTKANVAVDRKQLADLAVRDIEAFNKFVEIAKATLES